MKRLLMLPTNCFNMPLPSNNNNTWRWVHVRLNNWIGGPRRRLQTPLKFIRSKKRSNKTGAKKAISSYQVCVLSAAFGSVVAKESYLHTGKKINDKHATTCTRQPTKIVYIQIKFILEQEKWSDFVYVLKSNIQNNDYNWVRTLSLMVGTVQKFVFIAIS